MALARVRAVKSGSTWNIQTPSGSAGTAGSAGKVRAGRGWGSRADGSGWVQLSSQRAQRHLQRPQGVAGAGVCADLLHLLCKARTRDLHKEREDEAPGSTGSCWWSLIQALLFPLVRAAVGQEKLKPNSGEGARPGSERRMEPCPLCPPQTRWR